MSVRSCADHFVAVHQDNNTVLDYHGSRLSLFVDAWCLYFFKEVLTVHEALECLRILVVGVPCYGLANFKCICTFDNSCRLVRSLLECQLHLSSFSCVFRSCIFFSIKELVEVQLRNIVLNDDLIAVLHYSACCVSTG